MRHLLFPVLLLAACGAPKKNLVVDGPPPLVAASDPKLVTLEAALGNPYAPPDKDLDVIARFRVDTSDLPGKARPALRLTLVMDTSGSMEGEAIARAREAALTMVDRLEPGDRFALVVFNSKAEVLVPTTVMDGTNRESVRDKIKAIEATGTTDMAGGLSAALGQAAAGLDTQIINRIVLLSDGIPNDPAPILGLAGQAQSYGVPITALGIGLEFDETLLASIARTSGGTFEYIEKNEEVVEVFAKEVLRMKRLVARQMYLQVQPGPGVTIQGVIGFAPQVSGRGIYVTLGDLSQGERRDVLVRMRVKGHRAEARVELADATLTFQDAVQNAGSLTRNLFVSMRTTEDQALIDRSHDSEIERAAARAELGAAVVQAIALARGGNVDQARTVLDAAEPLARQRAKNFDDAELRLQLAELAPLRKALPTLVPPPPPPVLAGAAAAYPEPPQATPEEARAVRAAHDHGMKPTQPAPRDR